MELHYGKNRTALRTCEPARDVVQDQLQRLLSYVRALLHASGRIWACLARADELFGRGAGMANAAGADVSLVPGWVWVW